MAQFILVPFFVFTDDVISITKKYNITYRLSKSSTFSWLSKNVWDKKTSLAHILSEALQKQ